MRWNCQRRQTATDEPVPLSNVEVRSLDCGARPHLPLALSDNDRPRTACYRLVAMRQLTHRDVEAGELTVRTAQDTPFATVRECVPDALGVHPLGVGS